MLIIWISMFVVTFLAALSETNSNSTISLSSNGEEIRTPNKLLFFLVVMILVTLSGLRSSVGDTGYYMYSYSIGKNLNEVYNNRDWGYTIFEYILQKISPHPQFLLLVTSTITIAAISKTIYKYSRPLSLGVFVFVASGIYLSTMNGLRQYMVSAIIFASVELITENKKWKFIALILLLSTIHYSALIMIPVYFTVRQEAWSKKIIYMIIVLVASFVSFENLFGIFSTLLNNTQYGNYISTFGTEKFGGVHILRIFVAAVPVVLGYIYRNDLSVKLKNYNIYINFSVLNFIVLLFASYNWVFARFGIYFGLYNIILLPAIINYCFNSRMKMFIGYAAIVCYLGYFYFDAQPHIYASYFLDINRELIGRIANSMY